jgi:hypothetical protein
MKKNVAWYPKAILAGYINIISLSPSPQANCDRQKYPSPTTPDKSFLREIVRFDDKGASTMQILN